MVCKFLGILSVYNQQDKPNERKLWSKQGFPVNSDDHSSLQSKTENQQKVSL